MSRFITGFFLATLIFIGIWLLFSQRENKDELDESSSLIQQQIEQVGKLIVTEGNFSQVFTFKNSQNLFLNILKSDKKALVVANAKVTIEYDLRKLETSLDVENKTVIIKNIPDPVINIYPDIQYYDVTQEYFNKFGAADYNKIKNTVNERIRQKVDQSNMLENSQERLLAELTNIFVLTRSLGWTLQYNEIIIENEEELKLLKR
ncbi:MAG: DUF4230 domain-containing protein [Mongoliibacter sp.]|uniref:DUF4230 domain-containing protein n=1 Tax=Mongoliibacter sp. TaxID=2022438 RepID=UPI0012F207C7|nr:DUF4230 domain-containing protein [Mongoliibacter sp.]TVP51603.1 MAG: DUF4230 domain-containing protein [Mongoliibacter sp.]